jgi:hypothetical protein
MEGVESQRTRYQYAPLLDVLQFRILALYPAPSFKSPLRYNLQTSLIIPDLLKIDYEVLSYTWENSDVTSVVLFPDNATLPITTNLESSLRHRREQYHQVHLRVDALCINPKNMPERNSQIERIAMIYASAARLTVWLGPTHSDSDMAMEQLRNITRSDPFQKLEALEQKELTAI